MKNKIDLSGPEAIIVLIIGAILLVLCYGISWIVTCGIIKLITLCFGLTFKWSVATGIWLIICLLRSIFRVTIRK